MDSRTTLSKRSTTDWAKNEGSVRVLTVIVTDDASTTVMGGTFAAGQRVDVYGQCRNTDQFDAGQVVIIDDRRSP